MTFPGVAGGSLPAALRKAMVDKFEEFDEYQLAKYNRERKGIMVRNSTFVSVARDFGDIKNIIQGDPSAR